MDKQEKIIYTQLGIGLLIALIIGIGMVFAEQNESAQKANAGELEIIESSYDFGDIPITGGNVSHEYVVKNVGDSPISMKGLKTSCMCTSAVIEYNDGTVSPKFGMHNNPAFYSKELDPGEEATIIATYDPMFHGPTGTGNITRNINISTNKKNYSVKFTANVTN